MPWRSTVPFLDLERQDATTLVHSDGVGSQRNRRATASWTMRAVCQQVTKVLAAAALILSSATWVRGEHAQ